MGPDRAKQLSITTAEQQFISCRNQAPRCLLPGGTPAQWDTTKDAETKQFLQLVSLLLREGAASKLGPKWKSDRTA